MGHSGTFRLPLHAAAFLDRQGIDVGSKEYAATAGSGATEKPDNVGLHKRGKNLQGMSGERLSDQGGGLAFLEMDLGNTMEGMPQGDDLRQYRGDALAQIRAIYHVVIVSDNAGMVTAVMEPKRESDPATGSDSSEAGE
jgi:hypothetical protein